MSANPTSTVHLDAAPVADPCALRTEVGRLRGRRQRRLVIAALVGAALITGAVGRCGPGDDAPAEAVAAGPELGAPTGDAGPSGTTPGRATEVPGRFAAAALAALVTVGTGGGADEAVQPGASTSTTGPGAAGGGGAPGGDTGGGADGGGVVPAGPPVLSVDPTLALAPGATEGTIWLRNVGGSPLTWSVGDTDGLPLVSPLGGVIEPGQQAMAVFEWYLPQLHSDVDISIPFLSDGGAAEVAVHLTALEPVFSIVDGTWNIRNGNTFLVDYGVMDLGLTLRNDGTAPLAVDPQQVAGLDVIGGPWVLAPGQEVHLHVVLCNAQYSGGIPDFHDRDLHIHTDGWQGTLDFGVRFTLASGQVAPAC